MKSTTTLAFTGDIGFDHYMQNKWEDEHLIDERLVKILTSSDHVIANVEGPLVGDKLEKVKAAEMRLMHTISPEATVVLKRIHADIWNLANNHIMDAGPEGLEITLEEARKFGAQTIGAEMDLEKAKRPVILDEAGGIGLFGVGYQQPDALAGATWTPFRKSSLISRRNAAGALLSPTAVRSSQRSLLPTQETATSNTSKWAPMSSSPTTLMFR